MDWRKLLYSLVEDASLRFMPILMQIKEGLGRDCSVELQWVRRDYNVVVDYLAKMRRSQARLGCVLVEQPHAELQNLLLRDSFVVR